MKISKIIKTSIVALTAFILVFLLNVNDTYAAILDEILDYQITCDVNQDATVTIQYDVSWKVLDDSSEGPLEWVQIGLPNNHVNSLVGNTDNIDSIEIKNSGGTYAVIYFDRAYYEDEVIDFSYTAEIDYMYQYYPEEGLCEYRFTPGWFESAPVDNIEVRWNCDNTQKIEPSSLVENGYYTWNSSLEPNEKFSIEIQYPSDAFAFDLTQHENESSGVDSVFEVIGVIIGIFVAIMMFIVPMAMPALIGFGIYKAATGFAASTAPKKITRTIIEYYESCPNCGGSRDEGSEKCSYCGSNMVKSKKEVTEEEIPKVDKTLADFKTKGEYRYSSNPNTFVRVNVIPVPVARTSSSSGRSSGSSFHSSGSHSSCAHSSCACACACACAGGGRAGCSTKDFYNTDLKLKYLRKH